MIVDSREVLQHPEIPEVLGVPVDVMQIDAGDYIFLDAHNETEGIERCEIGNLVQKLRSGELESQLTKCDQNYNRIILLVEGVFDKVDNYLAVHKPSDRGYFRIHVYPNTRYDYVAGSLVSLSNMGIEVVFSPNFGCTMVLIRTIYNQRTKPDDQHSLFKKIRAVKIPVKLSSNPAVPRLLALTPRIGEKTAIRLINRYGSIWKIFNADEKDVLSTQGMGKTLLRKLKESVGKEE